MAFFHASIKKTCTTGNNLSYYIRMYLFESPKHSAKKDLKITLRCYKLTRHRLYVIPMLAKTIKKKKKKPYLFTAAVEQLQYFIVWIVSRFRIQCLRLYTGDLLCSNSHTGDKTIRIPSCLLHAMYYTRRKLYIVMQECTIKIKYTLHSLLAYNMMTYLIYIINIAS